MNFSQVLVTGAGGLMGRYVVSELRNRTRVAGLDLVPADGLVRHTLGSIEDPGAVARAIDGCDAVVQIAARPNQWAGTGSEIIETNTVGVWNVLEAAERAGVKRVVVTSSDSVVGYTVLHGAMIPPDYAPVDIAHPLRPTDPYALSKVLGERIARSFADRGKLEVVVLRPVYVLYPEFEGEVRARAARPDTYKGPEAGGRQPAGGGALWHYVDPRDIARAFRLALEVEAPGFGPYFISGTTTLAPEPTLDRLAKRIGRRIEVRDPKLYAEIPFAPIYDMTAARENLGYVPEHDLRRKLVDDR